MEASGQVDVALFGERQALRTAEIDAVDIDADALVSRLKFDDERTEQAKCVQAYTDAVKISLERYIAGKSEYFEVLEAQQQLFPAENTLAQIQLSRLLSVVQLYKALGGGWNLPQTAGATAATRASS